MPYLESPYKVNSGIVEIALRVTEPREEIIRFVAVGVECERPLKDSNCFLRAVAVDQTDSPDGMCFRKIGVYRHRLAVVCQDIGCRNRNTKPRTEERITIGHACVSAGIKWIQLHCLGEHLSRQEQFL